MSGALVMNSGFERLSGRKAQLSHIQAAKSVAEILKTCLGPRAMLKMLLDGMGSVVLTNDGHAILREIDVAHPAAKSMIELSRTQDEEVGDGTTSVIILAGEFLVQAIQHLERSIHPIVIISAYRKALDDALKIIDVISIGIDVKNDTEMLKLIGTSINTKFANKWASVLCSLALKAVRIVSKNENNTIEVDIKRYARIEKIPGGEVTQSKVLDGIMLNKDITHPKMRRKIENPRIILLDCPLEYKKGESQTNIEITKSTDWKRVLEIEEEQIKHMCDKIIEFKPDIVITEKGISDIAQHFLLQHNISTIRRVKKTDNNRIARAIGATVVNKVDDLKQTDVGKNCGLFEIKKIGDEYYSYFVQCKDPKACTILLRGPSKDILNEIERNLVDALCVARNVVLHPKLSPGGGATEMAVSIRLLEQADNLQGVVRWPYQSIAEAMEVIPRTLAQNCGVNALKCVSLLRAKHANHQHTFGINGETGEIVDMQSYGIWEPQAVKIQAMKTAIENACMLLRVDDIVSGVRKSDDKVKAMSSKEQAVS